MSFLHALWALLPVAAAEAPADPAERLDRVEKMYATYRSVGFAKVPEIDAVALKTRVSSASPPVLVDVRTPAEQAVSMIPGALTQEQYEARRAELAGRPVVTYCTIGARSGMYAKKLMDDGVEVQNLRGSLLLWTFAGGPLEHDGAPTTRVHTYGKKWALVADGYEPVY